MDADDGSGRARRQLAAAGRHVGARRRDRRPRGLGRLALVVVAAVLCGAAVAAAAGGKAEPRGRVAALVKQAGNAASDAERLKLLQELRGLAGLDERFAADLDRLIASIRRWLQQPGAPPLKRKGWSEGRLNYFGGYPGRDFRYDVAKGSPLHPIVCFYRARMLVWIGLENGFRQPAAAKEAYEAMRIAHEAFGDNPVAGMYLGRRIPPAKAYTAPPGAPRWAAHQREALERMADIIEWWIDHRMAPNGEYGGGWGDDCEMWRWWVPVLIAFHEPKIAAAQERFSRALLSQPHMKGGYSLRLSDVEHSAEDGSDALTPMMHLRPDDAEWKRRALRLAELMQTLWTGRNRRGLLQFKSIYISGDRVDKRPQRAYDTSYHARAVQPMLLYWQRTGDERVGKLVRAWMDMWVDAAMRSERGKPAGILPSGVHWPDGSIGRQGKWWDPGGRLYRWPTALGMMIDTLLLTYHMTGEAKYLQPLRAMARIRLAYLKNRPRGEPAPGSQAWCAAELGLLRGPLAKYRWLTGSTEFDELLKRDARGYLAFRLTGDESSMGKGLATTADMLRHNFAAYTSEVRYTDRVIVFHRLFRVPPFDRCPPPPARYPSQGLLYSTATGDPGGLGYFPLYAVRWLTPPREIAALVAHSDERHLTARLYHFGTDPRPMGAELYLLKEGTYRVRLRPAAKGAKPTWEGKLTVRARRGRVEFTLPPRTPCLLEIAPS